MLADRDDDAAKLVRPADTQRGCRQRPFDHLFDRVVGQHFASQQVVLGLQAPLGHLIPAKRTHRSHGQERFTRHGQDARGDRVHHARFWKHCHAPTTRMIFGLCIQMGQSGFFDERVGQEIGDANTVYLGRQVGVQQVPAGRGGDDCAPRCRVREQVVIGPHALEVGVSAALPNLQFPEHALLLCSSRPAR